MEAEKRPRLDLTRLLSDRGISYGIGSGRWIQLDCPMCGDSGQHLGYNLESGAFNCFKCGRHRTWEVLAKLFGLSLSEAGALARQYGDANGSMPLAKKKQLAENVQLKLPYGTDKLKIRHKNYLLERGFDSHHTALWQLMGTGVVGPFANRIIIPIHDQEGKLVCFQGRDITDKSPNKYKSCPDEEAVVPIKQCLYGIDRVVGRDAIVITEGVTKVWRLGPGAMATFGVNVSESQLKVLASFQKRIVLFDNDDAGREGADKLAAQLAPLGEGETTIVFPSEVDDVAELSNDDARRLMRLLLN